MYIPQDYTSKKDNYHKNVHFNYIRANNIKTYKAQSFEKV